MTRGGRPEPPRAGLALPTAAAQLLWALSCAAVGALSASHIEDEDPNTQGSGFEGLCHTTCSIRSHLLQGLSGVQCPVRSSHLRPASGSGLVWLPVNRRLRTCKQSSSLSLGVGQRRGLPSASVSRSKSKGQALTFPLGWPGLGVGWCWRQKTRNPPAWCLLLACPVQVLLAVAWQSHHGMQKLKSVSWSFLAGEGETCTTVITGWLYLLVRQVPAVRKRGDKQPCQPRSHCLIPQEGSE